MIKYCSRLLFGINIVVVVVVGIGDEGRSLLKIMMIIIDDDD